MRGLYSEGLIYGGQFAFQNRDWARLMVESKFNVFALFYFAFESNFPSTSPRRAYNYLEGQFNRGFFAVPVEGAYIWRGLYMEGLIFGILWYA